MLPSFAPVWTCIRLRDTGRLHFAMQAMMIFIVLGMATACQTADGTTRLVTATRPPMTLNVPATGAPLPVAVYTPVPIIVVPPTVVVPFIIPTASPVVDLASMTDTPATSAAPTAPVMIALAASPAPPTGGIDLGIYPTADWTPDPTHLDRLAELMANPAALVIGTSVEGRPLAARRLGTGSRIVLVIGGLHGGWETNTTGLAFALIDHFAAQPGDLPPDTALIVLPSANPDGTLRGSAPAGRFNANGVDLNRNWGCGWAANAVWRQYPVSAGSGAFSEPETQALASFITTTRPTAVIAYHSAAGGVFPGNCTGPGTINGPSMTLGAVLGGAAGLPCCTAFSAYPVTGTAADWIDGQGIAAVDAELHSHTDTDAAAQIAGVRAVLAWVAGR